MPDAMSGMMAKFFANFIPFIALLWALDSVLAYRILYREVFHLTHIGKIIPSLICIAFVILFLLLPIRTCINSRFANQDVNAGKEYKQVASNFQSDYDIENPVSKTEGLLRVMELKIETAGTDEEKQHFRN